MANPLPITITNRKGPVPGLKWLWIALWTLMLIYWLREKQWLWVAICVANLVLILHPDRSAALKRITVISLDDESLTIARADGSSFSVPASSISYAAVHTRRIDVAYLLNEEKLTQEFKCSDFDTPAWAELQLLAARFPSG
jgi:hypothetical protein